MKETQELEDKVKKVMDKLIKSDHGVRVVVDSIRRCHERELIKKDKEISKRDEEISKLRETEKDLIKF